MWRRFLPSARWRSAIVNGAAGTAIVAVVVVGLSIDDSVVTQVDARTNGVWLPVEFTGELVLVDPVAGVATTRVRVTEADLPVEVIDTDDLVGVVDTASGDLISVDPALGEVAGKAPLFVADVSDVVVSSDAWVVGGEGVARVPLDGSEPSLVEVPGPATSAAASADGVAVVIDETRVDVSPDGTTREGKQSFGLAVVGVGDQIATITPADGSVVLDDGTSTCVHGEVGVDTRWGGSTTGPRVVVGASDAGGTIHVSMLDRDRCVTYDLTEAPDDDTDPEPTAFSEPLVVDNVVYVADTTTGQLHIVNLDNDNVLSPRIFRSGELVELIDHHGEVIAHEPRTYRGGVFGPNGFRRFIDKSPGRQALRAVGGDSALVVGGGDDAAVESARAEGDATLDGELLIDDPVVLGLDEVADPGGSDDDLVANFAYSASPVPVGVAVIFVDESTGDPRSWTWDFGDGSTDSGPRVEHAWSLPGTYQVTLSIDRPDGASDSTAALIEVVPEETLLAPSADFTFSESTVEVGEAVRFTDVTAGDVTERRWEFGDGTESTEIEVSKSWPKAGSYTVTLTVANAAGSDFASKTIVVVDRLEPPNAVIDVSATEIEVGEPVRLRSVSTGDISRLFWDLGDGDVAASPEVVHTYDSEGSYTVTLTVANSAGGDTASVRIDVSETTLLPDARIGALPSVIEAGEPAVLTSTSLNNPDTLQWEFGDGTMGTGSPVTHTWDDPGTYVVTLTASSETGSDSTTVTVVVQPYLASPIASFDSPAEIRAGTPVQFVDTSSNGTVFAWSFGDGGTAATASAIHTFAAAGEYDVTFTVTNRNGTDEETETVEVLPALPVAGFVPSPPVARVGDTISFANTSTGASTYLWSFGDGSTSTLAAPTHVYAAQADYLVTLTITNSIGETDSASQTITINPLPPLLGVLTAAPSSGTTLVAVTFTVAQAVGSGEIVSYDWNFGDGSLQTTTTNTASHVYNGAGTYAVWVTATGLLPEDQVQASTSLTVNDPPAPSVSISASNATPELSQQITLTAVMEPGSGPISSYAWNFGDGTTATGASVTKAWSAVGAFTVNLTATGPVGATGAAPPVTINVVPPPPPVILTASGTPSPGFTNRAVNFSASLGPASGPVVNWQWDFGDGSPLSVPQATPGGAHTYSTAGTYTVTVTATGPVDTDSFSFPFTVIIPPPELTTPTFAVSPAVVNDILSFTVGSTSNSGTINSYSWSFSDGGVASGQSPTHTFTTTGPHSATVTATGPGGSDSATVSFTVYNPLSAQIGFTQIAGTLDVQFTGQSTGPPVVSWLWNFGDGTSSTVQNPLKTYSAAGTYSVTLTVTDAAGRTDTRPRSITVV